MIEMKIRSDQSVKQNKKVVVEASDFTRIAAEQSLVQKTVSSLAKRVDELEKLCYARLGTVDYLVTAVLAAS